MTATTIRGRALAAQDEAIATNVAKIEAAKRAPTALDIMATRLNVSAGGLKNTLLNTVFKKATDDEFAALVIVANAYGLNPLTKEIYAFPAKGGGIVPVVSIDGWLRIANEHPQMDGYEFEDIADDQGKLLAIETTIYRKDRTRPIKVTEYLDECKQNTDPWKNMPARMLRHKSFIQCARYAFGFSGVYDPDEATRIGDVGLADAPVAPMRTISGTAAPAGEEVDHDPITGEIRDTTGKPPAGGKGEGSRRAPATEPSPDLDEERRVAEQLDREQDRQLEGRTDDQHGETQNFDAKAFEKLLKKCETRIDFAKLDEEFQAVAANLPDEQYNVLMPLITQGRATFAPVDAD